MILPKKKQYHSWQKPDVFKSECKYNETVSSGDKAIFCTHQSMTQSPCEKFQSVGEGVFCILGKFMPEVHKFSMRRSNPGSKGILSKLMSKVPKVSMRI